MSINSTMRDYDLQSRTIIHKPSGAEVEDWHGTRRIKATIRLTDSVANAGNLRYGDNTHIGLTRAKYIKPQQHRLVNVKTGTVYQINKVSSDGRLTNLILREVDPDAG